MCDFSVDLGQNAAGYADELALLRPFALSGLLTVRANCISMTAKGRPYVRTVSAIFDRFRSQGQNLFSPSV
jgi:oxygen-independent coproporphyrinogen-3 oxidase